MCDREHVLCWPVWTSHEQMCGLLPWIFCWVRDVVFIGQVLLRMKGEFCRISSVIVFFSPFRFLHFTKKCQARLRICFNGTPLDPFGWMLVRDFLSRDSELSARIRFAVYTCNNTSVTWRNLVLSSDRNRQWTEPSAEQNPLRNYTNTHNLFLNDTSNHSGTHCKFIIISYIRSIWEMCHLFPFSNI